MKKDSAKEIELFSILDRFKKRVSPSSFQEDDTLYDLKDKFIQALKKKKTFSSKEEQEFLSKMAGLFREMSCLCSFSEQILNKYISKKEQLLKKEEKKGDLNEQMKMNVLLGIRVDLNTQDAVLEVAENSLMILSQLKNLEEVAAAGGKQKKKTA